MHKTDLAEVAGISSRTLAKLSKNEVVTTETLARIRAALHCDLGDIAGYSECTLAKSVYDAYIRCKELRETSEFWTLKEFSYQGKNFRVYRTRMAANKGTLIQCHEDLGLIE